MGLPGDNPCFKLLGVANLFRGRSRWKTITNNLYRVAVLGLLALLPIPSARSSYNTIASDNIVRSTKIFMEVVSYWSTVYFSYVSILLRDGAVQDVKTRLARLEKVFPMSESKRRCLTAATWIKIIFLATIHCTDYAIVELLSPSEYISYACYFINKFTVNLITCQFCALLWVVRYMYGQINDRLRRVARVMASDNKIFGRNVVLSAREELFDLRHYHLTVTRICLRLNHAHSVHMLFVLTNNTVEVICSLTEALFLDETCGDDQRCRYLHSILAVLWMGNYTVPVVIMVFSCSWVIDQAKMTQNLVSDIEMESDDELVIFLCESFTLELQVNRFSFTAANCFRVDKAMLLTNASTAVTYLIIEKQFAFDGFFSTYTGFES